MYTPNREEDSSTKKKIKIKTEKKKKKVVAEALEVLKWEAYNYAFIEAQTQKTL